MRLFILAAGKGTRLLPLTKNTPKSLLDLGDGTTLLDRQINVAIDSGVFNEIVVITGYRTEQIEDKIKDYKDKISIRTVFNPFYDVSNNLISLWTVGFLMLEDDFVVTNGDNMYKEGVFNKVYDSFNNEKEVIAITIDYKDEYDDDDMKVILDNNKNVVRVHKEIDISDTNAESVGLSLIKGSESREIYVNAINTLVKDKKYLNRFWLEIYNYLYENGYTVKTVEIDKNDWREMDFHPDLEILKKIVFNGFDN